MDNNFASDTLCRWCLKTYLKRWVEVWYMLVFSNSPLFSRKKYMDFSLRGSSNDVSLYDEMDATC